jgi:hypothetical protein
MHTCQNRYDAVVHVESVGGHWKITDLELLEEQRIDPNAPSSTLPADDKMPASR